MTPTLEDEALRKRGLRRCTRCVEVKALATFRPDDAMCKRCTRYVESVQRENERKETESDG